MLSDIRNPLEHEIEEKNFDKPVRVNNFWSNNYSQYESKGDRNETLSLEEYLNKLVHI